MGKVIVVASGKGGTGKNDVRWGHILLSCRAGV